MNGLILLVAGAIFAIFTSLWIKAENNGSKKKRISLGLLVIVTSLPLAVLITIAITQIDDNSYYSASVRIMLDESIDALEAKEPGFLPRLKAFRDSQRLTYETRGNLLENVRRFKDDGKELRNNISTEQAGAGYPPQGVGSPDP